MQPEYVSIGDLFSRESVFIVPLFQRPYVWDNERWELLWDDVSRVAEEALGPDQGSRRHFLGSIVVQQRPNGITEVPRREVIDGQQRLTTVQLLLKAIRDALETDGVTADAALPLTGLLRHPFAAKTDIEGSYKVWPTNADRARFRNVMDGTLTAKAVEEDRFASAYVYFRDAAKRWVAADDGDPEKRARRADALARTLRQHIWLIALNLAEDDQAQVIFETLNARGTPLTAGDLIKNLLLRRAQEEGEPTAALYEKYWRRFDDDPLWQQSVGAGHSARPRLDFFLQQALTVLTGNTIPMGQVYGFFARHLTHTRGKVGAAEHLKQISSLSETARRIYVAAESDVDRALVAAARIRAMDFLTALPVLLVLLGEPERDQADIAESATYLESFLVRRTVCGLNTGMSGLFFVDVMKAVAGATCASEAIRVRLMAETSDSTRWPNDAEFHDAWGEKELYRTLKRARLTIILRALEISLRDPDLTNSVAVPARLHVEHVMPRSWQQWWPLPPGAGADAAGRRDKAVHTIGNLTLLREKLNERLSNQPWSAGNGADKRSSLQQHGLMRLNSMLAGQRVWDEARISERSDALFAHAIRLWPHPGPH